MRMSPLFLLPALLPFLVSTLVVAQAPGVSGKAPAAMASIPVPSMVMVPAGSIRVGCTSASGNCDGGGAGGVRRPVSAFELGKYEVTFAEWDACVDAGGCRRRPDDQGWGRGDRPVINVDWHDARQYTAWLGRVTGKAYRLPSETEWEYAARAGTATLYSWGNRMGINLANCNGCGSRWDGRQTAPVGSFPGNPWGIHDLLGNVAEWTLDRWGHRYQVIPEDPTTWMGDECIQRVVRGGAWCNLAINLRSVSRYFNCTGGTGSSGLGFRVARSLTGAGNLP